MKPVSFEPIQVALDELQLPLQQYAVSDYVVSGVYFLFRGVSLTYIGQSDNVLARIGAHRASGKVFDTFSIFRCGREWLLPLEAAFIRKFQPSENRAHTKSDMRPSRSAESDLVSESVAVQVAVSGAQGSREWMRVREAAAYIGLSKSMLDKLRMDDGGPVYSKLGRTVVYRRSDLEAWAGGRSKSSTWSTAA